MHNNIKATAMAGLATALLTSGRSVLPSHIHSAANEKDALAAQKAMTEYSAQAPAMYAAMTANVDKFKVEEEYLLAELGKNVQSALGTKLPSMKWSEFKERTEHGKAGVDKFLITIAEEGARFRKAAGLAAAEKKTAEAQIEKAQKEIAAAKKNVTAWNAQIALLQQGFKDLPAGGKQLDAKAGLDLVKGIGSKKVTFVDADGKSQTKDVQEILQPQAEQIGALFTSKRSEPADGKGGGAGVVTAGPSLFPQAPGIALLILNHALELAKLELQKAETELSQAHDRAVLFEDALAEMKLAGQLYKDATNFNLPDVKGAAPFDSIIFDWAKAQSISSTLAKHSDEAKDKRAVAEQATGEDKKKKVEELEGAEAVVYSDAKYLRYTENEVAEAALIIRKLAIAESILNRNESTFKVKVARLEHVHSIANSALADAARRSLMGAQIDGLTAYHQGGFSKDDAANIIRIAQAVALFGIANNTK